jgi:hypothetical protein
MSQRKTTARHRSAPSANLRIGWGVLRDHKVHAVEEVMLVVQQWLLLLLMMKMVMEMGVQKGQHWLDMVVVPYLHVSACCLDSENHLHFLRSQRSHSVYFHSDRIDMTSVAASDADTVVVGVLVATR